MKRIASLLAVAALLACAPFAWAQQAPVRKIAKIAGEVYLSSLASCMPASDPYA